MILALLTPHQKKSTLHNSLVTFSLWPLLVLFTFSSVREDPQGTFLTMERVVGDGFASSMVSTGEILNPPFQYLVKPFIHV